MLPRNTLAAALFGIACTQLAFAQSAPDANVVREALGNRISENIPAILITADRSPNVRAAAREENIAILNKPVKPASLRALLGQWRAQQLVAAE